MFCKTKTCTYIRNCYYNKLRNIITSSILLIYEQIVTHTSYTRQQLALRSNFIMGLILDYTIIFMFCMTCIYEIAILK
jgi:hypothetical protein